MLELCYVIDQQYLQNIVQVFRHANSHNNSARVRNRLCRALVHASKRGLVAFGVPPGVNLSSQVGIYTKFCWYLQ